MINNQTLPRYYILQNKNVITLNLKTVRAKRKNMAKTKNTHQQIRNLDTNNPNTIKIYIHHVKLETIPTNIIKLPP